MRKPPLYKSFMHAASGYWQMVISERNFQLELLATAINMILIFYFKLNVVDSGIILLCCAIVLSAEIFNTAIEKICDIIQPDFDTRIKFIKDISAASVFILSIASVIIGLLIYSKYFDFT